MEQLDQQIQTALAYAMLFVLVATPIVDGLDSAARRFQEHARETPDDRDDTIADKLVSWTSAAVVFLAKATSFLPTLRKGPKQ